MILCKKKIFLALLFLVNNMQIFTGTQKTLTEYDETVLKNELIQDICKLLDGMGYTTDAQKNDIMSFIFSDTGYSLPYSINNPTDRLNIESIKKEIANVLYKSKNEAEQTKHLVSRCLVSLPNRGIAYTFSTILRCFKITKSKMYEKQ